MFIDQSTFIAGSLITCGEYQLFIDELREQGKHYQPDHWVSYQHPEGQALEPILGVRPRDAEAFCRWFTNLESENWRFRLLTYSEAIAYPIQSSYPSRVGYLTIGDKNACEVVWTGPNPVNARAVNPSLYPHIFQEQTLNHIKKIDKTLDPNQRFEKIVVRISNHNLNVDRILNIRNYHKKLLKQISSDVEARSERREDAIRNSSDKAYANDRALMRDSRLVDELDLSIQITEDLVLERVCQDKPKLIHKLNNAFNNILSLTRYHAHTLDTYLYPLLDLYTLQERIAGRSSAFEGIRIVRERVS